MSFCTLTPGEVLTLTKLISQSEEKIDFTSVDDINKVENVNEMLFQKDLVSIKNELVNEAQLEFTILSSLEPFSMFLADDYVLCRQVPISPFKPSGMDRADICLYSMNQPIKNGTIPNIIIELKKDVAKKDAYIQVSRYLRWLETITTPDEFKEIRVYIIAHKIGRIKKSKVDLKYSDKIKLYSIDLSEFVLLED